MTVTRASTLEHWESYWKGVGDVETTYSTAERLAREILADGPVDARPVLEVGAGSGRDTLALARAWLGEHVASASAQFRRMRTQSSSDQSWMIAVRTWRSWRLQSAGRNARSSFGLRWRWGRTARY